MGSIRSRKDQLFFDFRYHGIRCREQTLLEDNPTNRQRLENFMLKIDKEIAEGTFQYAKYFPNSKNIAKTTQAAAAKAELNTSEADCDGIQVLSEFAEEWFLENEISWKVSHQSTIRSIINKYLNPTFGDKKVNCITKGDILKFRATLAKVQIGSKTGLSPVTINHIMTVLRMILNDAADRSDFNTPFRGIKPLKEPKVEVDPFNIDELNLFLSRVRQDMKNYYTVRFFTGMRTGEIDGLKWQYVDFDKKQILIRETIVQMRIETPKTTSSLREIHMSAPVMAALKAQYEITAIKSEYVFCNKNGKPFDHRNVTKRIWYPTLQLLGLKKRRPYQTRHTMATLWLASGENPEWIARQMGHTSTEMLFTVYSRYVPNLTRNDGSAFENLLACRIKAEGGANG